MVRAFAFAFARIVDYHNRDKWAIYSTDMDGRLCDEWEGRLKKTPINKLRGGCTVVHGCNLCKPADTENINFVLENFGRAEKIEF